MLHGSARTDVLMVVLAMLGSCLVGCSVERRHIADVRFDYLSASRFVHILKAKQVHAHRVEGRHLDAREAVRVVLNDVRLDRHRIAVSVVEAGQPVGAQIKLTGRDFEFCVNALGAPCAPGSAPRIWVGDDSPEDLTDKALGIE